MRRRQLLAGLTSLAGGVGVIGTGAFTSVTASRDVSVTVAQENQAYLALRESTGPNGAFSNSDSSANNQISLDFNGEISPDGSYDSDGPGTGVGRNSEYKFDDVFRVANQGTQTVYVTIADVSYDSGAVTVQFYVRDGSDNVVYIDGSDGELELATGNRGKIGAHVVTNDASTDSANSKTTTITGRSSSFGATTTVSGSSP